MIKGAREWLQHAGLRQAGGRSYWAHFQRYPVLALTFKDLQAATWKQGWSELRRKISSLFAEHRWLLSSGQLTEWEVRDFRAVLDHTAEAVLYGSARLDLSRLLQRASGEPVVILIDEYDGPIHAAYAHGYAKEGLRFATLSEPQGSREIPIYSRR